MSDKTSSSVGPRSFETISEEDLQSPWDKLLGDQKPEIPRIIKTDASNGTISRNDELISSDPRAEDLEANRLTRSRSLNQRRNSSSTGLFGSFHKQLRMSLRGVRSEPSSVKDVPTSRTDSFFFKYRQARYAARRVRKRVIFKHGDCNVVQWNVAKRRRRYLQDIFTTLVDAQWRWTLLVFALNFLLSWLFFALVWWLIIFTHGDLSPESHVNDTDFKTCLAGVNSFTGCFLFSVETQHTIGYGSRTTTEECPEAIFVMCLQSIVGVFIQAFMVGIVFAKLSRPKKRAQTLLYSRNAVICLRDGQLCLMFRVGDMRKSHIVEAHIRAQVIRRKVTREGEVLPFYQQELKVGADGEEDRLMFIWPMTIVHKINERSPLYNLSASDMLRERFEIVVMLEGVIESTGMTTQARSSFLPSEILWGHRFEAMVSFRKDTGEYEVDYTRFNNTYEVDTPLCSAKTLDDLRATVSTSQKLDRMLGTIPKSFSNDTLDMSSVDSMSLDEHIEIKIPESRVRENRLMAQTNFVQHINEKSRNYSNNHLTIDNGMEFSRNPTFDQTDFNQSGAESNLPKNHNSAIGIEGAEYRKDHRQEGKENRNGENRIELKDRADEYRERKEHRQESKDHKSESKEHRQDAKEHKEGKEHRQDAHREHHGHLSRSHSRASMKRVPGHMPNGIGHNGLEEHHHDKIIKLKKSPSEKQFIPPVIPTIVTTPDTDPVPVPFPS